MYVRVVPPLDGTAVVTPRGELDLAARPALRSSLLRAQSAREVIVDLSAVTFLDASALGVLVWAHHRQRARGGRLVIVGAVPPVMMVFALTGLLRVLDVQATMIPAQDRRREPPGDLPAARRVGSPTEDLPQGSATRAGLGQADGGSGSASTSA